MTGTEALRALDLDGAAPQRRRRAEQRLLHRQRPGDRENLPAAPRRRAAGDRGHALPHRGRPASGTRPPSSARPNTCRPRASRWRSPRSSPSCGTRATRGTSCSTRSPSTSTPRAVSVGQEGAAARSPIRSTSAASSAGGRRSCMRPSRRRRSDRAFKAEPITDRDVARWAKAATRDVTRALDVVAKAAPGLTGEAKADAAALHKARKAILARRLGRGRAAGVGPQDAHPWRLPSRPGAGGAGRRLPDRLRGRAAAGLAERREKTSPLRDVAGHAPLLRLCRVVGARPAARTDRRGRPGAPRPGLRLARHGGPRLCRGLLAAAKRAASCRTRSSRRRSSTCS